MIAPSQMEHQGKGKVGMANESESSVEVGLIWLMRARCEVLGYGASTNRSEVGMLEKCYW